MIKLGKILFWFICLLALFVGIFGSCIIYGFSLSFVVSVVFAHYLMKFLKLLPLIAKLVIEWIKMSWRKVWEWIKENCLVTFQYAVYIVVIIILIFTFCKEEHSYVRRFTPYVNVIVGVFVTFLVMRPDFKIEDTLALSVNNRLRINIKNKFFFFRLHNVSVELEFEKFDDKTQDTQSWPVKMVAPSLQVLYGRYRGNAKSSQTFHTQEAFVWNDDFTKLKCRVSATHAVSRITRIKEKTFRLQDIMCGEYVKGAFVSQDQRYITDAKTQKQLNAISIFSRKVLPASLNYPIDEYEIRQIDKKYETAIGAIKELRKEQELFQNINDYDTLFDQLEKDISCQDATNADDYGLLQIYTNNKILYGKTRERRDKLTKDVNSLVLIVSHYLERQIRKNTK